MEITSSTGKQNIKRLRSVLKIVLLLGIVLSLHLWAMANHKMADNATIQLSKLNFDKSADENDIAIVGQALRSKDGVKSVNYFPEQKSMVVAYNNLHLTGKEVLKTARQHSPAAVSAYVPETGNKAMGCPIHADLSYADWVKLIKNMILN
ncbi:MAG TPA: hypothetical protein PLQ57_13955 [Saprospiraceae bacterium]|nr:hypothetical protein [Saprospiraceae bacterium]HRG65521.1 hypothetical protein [Saprospiraceae bacterium]